MFHKKILQLLFLVLACVTQQQLLNAQTAISNDLQFLNHTLPIYPKLMELINLTCINKGEHTRLEIHLELIKNQNDTLSVEGIARAERGIAALTFKSIYTNNKNNSIITEDSILLPGQYQINLGVFKDKKKIYVYSSLITVNNYITNIIKHTTDSIELVIEPEDKNLVHYLVCYSGTSGEPQKSYLLNQKNFKIPSIIDSNNVFFEIKSYYRSTLVSSSSFRNKPAIKKQQFHQKLSHLGRKQDIVKLGGNITFEHLESNLRFGGQQLPTSYTRMYISPEISVWGIPFKANFVRGTDNNQQFPINSFNFEFDAYKFKDELSKKVQQQIAVAKEEIESNNFSISNLNKSNLKLSDKIKSDSVRYSNINDTTNTGQKRNSLKKKIDTNILELNKNISEINQLTERNTKLLRLIGNKQFTAPQNPNDSILQHKRLFNKKFYRLFNNLNALKFGIIYPMYSELIYSGLPLNGFLADYKIRNVIVKIARGKSPYSTTNQFNNNSFSMNTNLVGILVRNTNSILKLEFGNFNQTKNTAQSTENNVILIGNEFQVNKAIRLTAEIAKSSYVTDNSIERIRYKSRSIKTFNDLENISFLVNTDISIKSTQINLTYKRVDQSYLSLGVPFARQDAEQLDFGIKQGIDKSRIQVSGGIMTNKDNLSNNKILTTFVVSWYGKLTINYLRYPKIMVSYKPTQINTSINKDFITQNNNQGLWSQQLNNLNVIVDYSFKTAGLKHKNINTFNHFRITDFFNNQNTYKIFSSQVISQLTNKLNSSITYQIQLNNNSNQKAEVLEINLTKTFRGNIGIGSIGLKKEKSFLNGNRQGILGQFSSRFSNVSTSINLSINEVTEIWGDYYYDKFIEYRLFVTLSYTL